MELICEKKENSFQSFSCGNTKVTFDNNGYVIKAEGFSLIMWGTLDLDEKLIGKHIIELARILKKYIARQENYISFLENVVLKFYEEKEKSIMMKNYDKRQEQIKCKELTNK
mgnify:FL=1